MNIDDIPIWLLFVLTTLLVVAAIEVGYQVGNRARRRSEEEKESPVGAIVGTVLALLAFILAFTFGIVSDRYDARKGTGAGPSVRDPQRLFALRFSARTAARRGQGALQRLHRHSSSRRPIRTMSTTSPR